jgi:hypothetical protein
MLPMLLVQQSPEFDPLDIGTMYTAVVTERMWSSHVRAKRGTLKTMMILLLVLVVTGPYPAIASSRDHTIAAAILEVIFPPA